MIGTTSARMTSTVGEISRVYGSDKITQKLGILGLIAVLGTLVGPCTTFIFQYVDISIGNWKWNIGNMVGISMTAFYLFQFIFVSDQLEADRYCQAVGHFIGYWKHSFYDFD